MSLKRDVQATDARKFMDPRSYVAKDGRELLLGLGNLDWIRRKTELYSRSGGRCEYINEDRLRCSKNGEIPAHVIPRKDITQRDDRMFNLRHFCYEHDRLTEKQAWRRIRSDRKERRDGDTHGPQTQ